MQKDNLKNIFIKKHDDCLAVVETFENNVESFDFNFLNSIYGNIYKARVENVVVAMNSVFVNIGKNKNAILPNDNQIFSDITYVGKEDVALRKMKVGDYVLCQVIKDENNDKGAVVTQNFTLSSKNLILTTGDTEICISKKITDMTVRSRLKKIVRDCVAKARIEHKIGFIIRTEAVNTFNNIDIFNAEIDILVDKFKDIVSRYKTLTGIKEVYHENFLQKFIWDKIREGTNYCFYVNNLEIKKQVEDFFKTEKIDIQTKLYDTLPTFIMDAATKLFSKKVDLTNGGYLYIERTEAMNVIDVNSGSNINAFNKEETAKLINMAAVNEIAHQVKIRNLSGIIIIDFIDMKNVVYQNELITQLKKVFLNDTARIYIGDMSKLGLVEMTRGKVGQRHKTEIFDVCDKCDGDGKVFNATFLSLFK